MSDKAAVEAYALKTNGRFSPREVDPTRRLRLTWRLRSKSGASVESHRVSLIAQSDVGLVWDSGWILGDETALAAPPAILRPVTDYRWRLEVRLTHGAVETAEARFTTGLQAFTGQ